MNQKEILEFNRKCAEFLKWEEKLDKLNAEDEKAMFFYTPFSREFWSSGTSITGQGWEQTKLFTPKDMKFHSDWNWIMEVVGAIEKLDYFVHTLGCGCFITTNNAKIMESNNWNDTIVTSTDFFNYEKELPTKKEAVVQAIAQFLTWYSANKRWTGNNNI